MNYIELEVWKEARQLTVIVYKQTSGFPVHERFSLVSQMRRSAISVLSNIAEGCGRRTPKDTLHFLYMSRGSLFELEAQCLVSLDLGFIDGEQLDYTQTTITRMKKLLNGFIGYFRQFDPSAKT